MLKYAKKLKDKDCQGSKSQVIASYVQHVGRHVACTSSVGPGILRRYTLGHATLSPLQFNRKRCTLNYTGSLGGRRTLGTTSGSTLVPRGLQIRADSRHRQFWACCTCHRDPFRQPVRYQSSVKSSYRQEPAGARCTEVKTLSFVPASYARTCKFGG